jgi:hypothetical protein
LLQLTFFDSPGHKAHEKHKEDVSSTDNSPSPQNPLSVYNDQHQGKVAITKRSEAATKSYLSHQGVRCLTPVPSIRFHTASIRPESDNE